MIATPTTTPTFTANGTTTIAPSTMATVTKTLMATPTTTIAVATASHDEDIARAQSRMKMTRENSNCSRTSVVSEESGEEGMRGAVGGGGEEEWGRKKSQVSWRSYVGTVEVNDLRALLW
jgi:hypothetical protein